MTTLYEFKIGTTLVGIVNLESLTVPVVPPRPTYSPYSNVIELGDGGYRGVGAPVASWHWDFLPRTMRDQLRVFCPDVSAAVYIQTYTKDGGTTPSIYLCKMHWPITSEETQTAKAIDFTINFTELVLQV